MKKYKLVKKLPFENSPRIGYISKPNEGELHYYNHNWFKPKDYPEFWEEVVEKDYEILKVKAKSNHPNAPVNKVVDSWVNINLDYFDIYSVKRLSDGEVFTVGDNTNEGIIRSFIFYNRNINTIDVYCDYKFQLQHIKKIKKPLFTTEDGVNIFKGDDCWACDKNLKNLGKVNWSNNHPYSHGLYFSTKEAAEKYILMNKPCLSIKEIAPIIGRCNETTYADLDCLTEKLKELVKAKL